MKKLFFKNGDSLPSLGLGTWKSEPGEVYNAVIDAIKDGYRHFDCAMIYGNEAEIGEALKEAMNSGLVKRDELWITSKLWSNSHGKGNVIAALKTSLSNLQLNYLDLYLVHWPVAFKAHVIFPEKASDMIDLKDIPVSDTWRGMEEVNKMGLAKHIGVCNFSIKKLKQLMSDALVKPEMNQIEMHPFLQQNEMLSYCKTAGIHLTSYSPLGSPDRTAAMKADNEPSLLENPVIMEIASKNQCSPAQVLIAWAIERGTAVIPKSVNAGRIKQNFEATGIHLAENDMARIAALDKHFRYVDGAFFAFPGSSYTVANLWDE